jgi:hypothetical protein
MPKLKPRPKPKTNDIPPSQWPIKKGTKVWGVELRAEFPSVICGKVVHYNPAVVSTNIQAKGLPFYIVDNYLIAADRIFPYTAKGQSDALFMLADLQQQRAMSAIKLAREQQWLAAGTLDAATRILKSWLKRKKK